MECAEQLAISLYVCREGLGVRHTAETFQRSLATVSKRVTFPSRSSLLLLLHIRCFHSVLRALISSAVYNRWIQQPPASLQQPPASLQQPPASLQHPTLSPRIHFKRLTLSFTFLKSMLGWPPLTCSFSFLFMICSAIQTQTFFLRPPYEVFSLMHVILLQVKEVETELRTSCRKSASCLSSHSVLLFPSAFSPPCVLTAIAAVSPSDEDEGGSV